MQTKDSLRKCGHSSATVRHFCSELRMNFGTYFCSIEANLVRQRLILVEASDGSSGPPYLVMQFHNTDAVYLIHCVVITST